MYAPDPDEKFDYQNMDVKLYLALRNLVQNSKWVNEVENTIYCDPLLIKAAERAMYEFTNSFGPIPDWAVDRNWDYSLVPGAQLCTKDGRRTGNAHIIRVDKQRVEGEWVDSYNCLTDAGSQFHFTEVELLEAFNIGDWISDPARVIHDFDRNGEFSNEQ